MAGTEIEYDGMSNLSSGTRVGREVAIKILPAHFPDDPEWLRRFEQEARALTWHGTPPALKSVRQ